MRRHDGAADSERLGDHGSHDSRTHHTRTHHTRTHHLGAHDTPADHAPAHHTADGADGAVGVGTATSRDAGL